MKTSKLLLCAAAVLLGVGCKPAVKTVTVSPPMSALGAKGASTTLTAAAVDAKGKPVADAKIVWASATPKVATIDNGKVTAVSSGLADLTAKVGEVTGKAQVRVTIPAKLDVKPPTVELTGIGVRAGLLATVVDDLGGTVPNEPLTWTSSDEKVVQASGGQLVATGAGSATVTVSGAGLKADVAVTVKVPEVAKLTLEPKTATLASKGATAGLTATTLDAKGQPVLGVPVHWASSSDKVATIGPTGMVTAVKKGKATITASVGKLKATSTVTVKK